MSDHYSVSECEDAEKRIATLEAALLAERTRAERAEKDWRKLLLLIAEVCGEEDPEAAVDDEYDPWTALRRLASPSASATGEAEAWKRRAKITKAVRKFLGTEDAPSSPDDTKGEP